MTSTDDLDLVRGSGNVFRDFGYIDAEALHLKAKLAARVIGILEDKTLTAKSAEHLTGIPAAEFSRILNAKLSKFSIERMLKILAALGQDVDVDITFNKRANFRELRSA
jgi:predicted XRE-type DNA-binding protein